MKDLGEIVGRRGKILVSSWDGSNICRVTSSIPKGQRGGGAMNIWIHRMANFSDKVTGGQSGVRVEEGTRWLDRQQLTREGGLED